MKKNKSIPKFKSEDEEREFWATHDATDYFDVSQETKLDLSELQPTTKEIILELPESLISSAKKLANKRQLDVNEMLKYIIAEKVEKENKKIT